MIIGFGSAKDYKRICEWYNSKGVELIKKAKSEVQAKETVNIAVLNCLNSFEDFWNTNVFYSKLDFWKDKCCDVLLILEKGLKYFCDKRKKKLELADCEEKIQEIIDGLNKYIVNEKDAEDIRKFNETRLGLYSYNAPMPSEAFFEGINRNIRLMELKDKYEGENNKASISRFQFVKDTIQQIGVSDSYMAQIMYNEIRGKIEYCHYSGRDMDEVITYLEIYRCIVIESTASEEELRMEYSPCV